MKLDYYIEGVAPILPSSDRLEITFRSQVVCDCGGYVDAFDNYCRKCGAPVRAERPVLLKLTWGEVKDLVRPLIEAEYKKRLELMEYCNEKSQHN